MAKPAPKKPLKKVRAVKPPRMYARIWHSCRPCDFDACNSCGRDHCGSLHPHALTANKTGALPPELELLRKCDLCGATNTGKAPARKRKLKVPAAPRRKWPVAKKPIIYLYPVAPCEATVQLALKQRAARLSVLLPEPLTRTPQAATWRVAAQPDGTLQPLGGPPGCPPVASLFWEAAAVAAPGALLPRGARDTFCIPGAAAGSWLLAALRAQGLAVREYTECASFWAPQFAEHAYVVLRLVPQQQWEALAPLTVSGLPATAPTRTLRVFVAWRGVPAFSAAANQGTLPPQAPSRQPGENWVVEWGGQECPPLPPQAAQAGRG